MRLAAGALAPIPICFHRPVAEVAPKPRLPNSSGSTSAVLHPCRALCLDRFPCEAGRRRILEEKRLHFKMNSNIRWLTHKQSFAVCLLFFYYFISTVHTKLTLI